MTVEYYYLFVAPEIGIFELDVRNLSLKIKKYGPLKLYISLC